MTPRALTWRAAEDAARAFLADLTPSRQWTVATMAAYLPPGWYLTDCQDDEFQPLSVKRIAFVLRAYARREQ